MRDKAGEFEQAVDFLQFFKDFWINFCMQMQSMRDIFLVLERTYLQRVKGTTFWQMSLQAVKSRMNETMRKRLMDGAIELI